MMMTDESLVTKWIEQESKWREEFSGWNFSKLIEDKRIVFNMSEEKLGWDYEKIVYRTLVELTNQRDANDEVYVLDLGTGGGEFLETLLLKLDNLRKKLKIYATESFHPNLLRAQQRLNPHNVQVVLSESDSLNSSLPFDDDRLKFDLILSRHTCFNIREVNRLLKCGTGLFITEQVDGNSEIDLIRFFGHEAQWSFFNLNFLTSILREQTTDMKILETFEGETKIEFKDVDALIVYLHAVPWLIEDFSVEKYQTFLLKLNKLTFKSKYLFLKAMKSSS